MKCRNSDVSAVYVKSMTALTDTSTCSWRSLAQLLAPIELARFARSATCMFIITVAMHVWLSVLKYVCADYIAILLVAKPVCVV